MKNLKYLFIAVAIFAFQSSFATVETEPVKPSEQLRNELVKLIGTECNFEFDKDECTAEILFTVNTKGEVIVLSVTSSNPNAEGYIKSKINYKKVDFQVNREGEIYLLPMRVVKES